MSRTRIKICGITSSEDADMVVAAGVDAIGFNFYTGSKRFLRPEAAVLISRQIPAFVVRTGLFVDEDAAEVERIAGEVGLDLLQFHGNESAAYCESFSLPYIKALSGSDSTAEQVASYTSARGILFDTSAGGEFGGTGQTFDWSLLPEIDCPVILAGGLTDENVGDAIRRIAPFAVDASSSVESGPGKKDPEKVRSFIKAVIQADQERA